MKLGDKSVGIQEGSTTATLDLSLSPRWTLTFALGAILGGHLDVDGTSHEVLPGWMGAVGVGYRLVDGRGVAPFVLVDGSLGVGRAKTRERGMQDTATTALTSGDLRLGVIVGKSFGPLSPYLAARAFGGPVAWHFGGESLTGGDKYHYQFGAGFAVALSERVDMSVEGDPIGEQRVTFALSIAL